MQITKIYQNIFYVACMHACMHACMYLWYEQLSHPASDPPMMASLSWACGSGLGRSYSPLAARSLGLSRTRNHTGVGILRIHDTLLIYCLCNSMCIYIYIFWKTIDSWNHILIVHFLSKDSMTLPKSCISSTVPTSPWEKTAAASHVGIVAS